MVRKATGAPVGTREYAAIKEAREASRRCDGVEAAVAAERRALGRTYRAAWEADRRSRRAGEKAEQARLAADAADRSSYCALQSALGAWEYAAWLEGRVRQVEREGRMAAYDRARACRRMDVSALACVGVCALSMLVAPWVGDSWPWLVAVVAISSASGLAMTSDAVGSGPRKRALARASEERETEEGLE